jgi:predicted DNA-binding transcriptional regulator AlpA
MKRNTASTDRSKNDRITRNKKECDIATYKTRAEIIAQNPVRDGDDELLTSSKVCAIVGISTTTLSRWNTESPPRIPFVRLSKGNYRWRKSELEAYLERQHVDRRKVDRRSGSCGFPISRRTTDRRSVDRGSVEKLTV